MEYVAGYVVFGILFVVGAIGFWVVTRVFKDGDGTVKGPAA